MHQVVETLVAGKIQTMTLPPAKEHVMEGVRWGKFDELFTPAYWASQAWIADQNSCVLSHRLGTTLTEEIAVCMLGGFGMSADLGLAAFQRIRDAGFLHNGNVPSENSILELLSEPLDVNGRKIKYRYPRQRSRYLFSALKRLSVECPPLSSDLEFRAWLLSFAGIGPKTASWITRNWLKSDNVAIIDVHIHRAGILIGVFNQQDDVGKDYFKMEKQFLIFASAIGVAASNLDDMMWQQMRQMNRLAIRIMDKACLIPAT